MAEAILAALASRGAVGFLSSRNLCILRYRFVACLAFVACSKSCLMFCSVHVTLVDFVCSGFGPSAAVDVG